MRSLPGRAACAAVLALLLAGGCRADSVPGSGGTQAGAAGGDTTAAVDTLAAGVTGAAGAVGAEDTLVGGRPEWDSDRARQIWADARARGASFRAVGQEPGWNLELFEGERIVFVTDYGERRVVAPWPSGPQIDTAAERVVIEASADAGTLVIDVERRACTDAMSGEPFDFTVTVTLAGTRHDGCGRQLR